MEIVPGLLIGLIYLVMAYAINERNARYLLSGYNTMSGERRKQYDIGGFLVVFRRYFSLLAVSVFVVTGLCYVLDLVVYSVPVIIFATFVSLPYLLVKSRSFDRGSTNRKWSTFIAIGILMIVAGGVIWLFAAGLRDNKLNINGQSLEITGMYGEVIDITDLVEVSLVEELPAITMRSNGFALGPYRKGYFRTATGENIKLYLNGDPPYLKLATHLQTYFWNAPDGETALTYELVKAAME